MIGRLYRLVDAKRVELAQREIHIGENAVIVRPHHLAICAADQRYYLGLRRKDILSQKLPMALIHEATGTVLHDPGGALSPGTKAVLVPLDPHEDGSAAKANYRPGSLFASSGADGFMRDIIALSPDRLVPVTGEYSMIYVFSELLSVALGAIAEFEASRRTDTISLGVWGDGSMGFVTALALRCLYPESKLFILGKSERKLRKFSFATKAIYIDKAPSGFSVSHAFECVGGVGSGDALEQISELIEPQGCISLLGVSEEPIALNTRRVLEKGLRLIGNSRSDAGDFKKAVQLIRDNNLCRHYLPLLVSEVIPVSGEADISKAFEQDVLNDFKTVIEWEI